MYMLFAVRGQHDEQPSGGASLPRILHCHHIAASYFTILTVSTFLIAFSTSTFTNMYTFSVSIDRTNIIVSISGFIDLRDGAPPRLREHVVHVHGELGPHHLREGQQRARHVHRVVDVPVP